MHLHILLVLAIHAHNLFQDASKGTCIVSNQFCFSSFRPYSHPFPFLIRSILSQHARSTKAVTDSVGRAFCRASVIACFSSSDTRMFINVFFITYPLLTVLDCRVCCRLLHIPRDTNRCILKNPILYLYPSKTPLYHI